VAIEQPPQCRHADGHPGLGQDRPELREREVGRARHRLQDLRRMRFDASPAAITAQPARNDRARLAQPGAPADGTLAALTSNRAAAARHEAPANTARTTRSGRSTDSALDMPAGLPTGRQLESHS
jgi:hypothetical protein